MKSSGKRRPPNRSSGGPRTLTYILLAVIAVLVFYYGVLPVFTPKSTVTVNPNAPKVSLSTGSDIAGVYVVVSGKNLPANQGVTASFGTSPLALTNRSSGATSCATTSKGLLSGCTFWVPDMPAGHYVITFAVGSTSTTAKFSIPKFTPPVSTVLVTVTSVALGLVTQIVTKKVVDLNAERRMRAEVSAFNKEKREASLAKDKDKVEKLKKRELAMQQEQLKVQKARFKVMGITTVPLILVYYLMASFLGGYGVIVAFTPIPIPVITGATQNPAVYDVSLFWWYFLSSFTFSTMLGRLLHTTT